MANNILSVIADNEALSEALRELLEKQFETEDVDDRTMSDVQLGQIFRARVSGLAKIEKAMTEIAKCRTREGGKGGRVNPAR